jgi:hypothetical protein
MPAVTPGTISNATPAQCPRLFAAAPEDERIPAFQPDDALAVPRQPNEQRVDLFLPRRLGDPAALADVVERRPATRVGDWEKRGIRERIVDHGVAVIEQGPTANGQQPGIPWPRTDEVDDARGPFGSHGRLTVVADGTWPRGMRRRPARKRLPAAP